MPCSRRAVFGAREYAGGVAQLGERVNGIHEVRGSIPLASTVRGAPKSTRGNSGRFGRKRRTYDQDNLGPLSTTQYHSGRGQYAGIAQLVEHNLAKVG